MGGLVNLMERVEYIGKEIVDIRFLFVISDGAGFDVLLSVRQGLTLRPVAVAVA